MSATDTFRKPQPGTSGRNVSASAARAALAPHRVFLLQNHPLMVLGTRTFIESQPDMIVCGAALVPGTVSENLPEPRPSVIILELSICGPFDFTFLQKLRKEFPEIPILAFSYHEEIIFAERALEAGANGFLMKETNPQNLGNAIRQVAAGQTYLSERVRHRLERERQIGDALNGSRVKSFTNRELQIFQALGEGLSDDAIGIQTGLSRQAIGSAQYRMRKKLGLETRAQLADCARHWAYYEGDFA